ncbi:MAG: AraC family transcriptional regulator [bacterium]|nr:AraC family transcriptional regulator [bacterium]
MAHCCLPEAIENLSAFFSQIKWRYLEDPAGSSAEKTQLWPGDPTEEIVVCVAKGIDAQELFHRQDYFFLNYAYRGDYDAISHKYDNRITIREGECYISQPYAGYAIMGDSAEEIIVGVLVQKETFFKTFLPVLSADAKLFRFFLEPQTNACADEFIHLRFADGFSVRTLLEMMMVEYANKREDTQAVLRPLALALFMQVARQYRLSSPAPKNETPAAKIVRYMSEHTDAVTLKTISAQFSYHPNYVSALLHRELGKTFSEILLEQRMERAAALLKGTTLTVEEIALMLGYSNSSNFYKAFREFYHASPREYKR